MSTSRVHPVIWWAWRDLGRHPAQALLVSLGLCALLLMTSLTLLVSRGVQRRAVRMARSGPSLVVTQVALGSWVPMDDSAVETISGITGVTQAYPRVWTVAQTERGPITVMGLDAPTARALSIADVAPPAPDQVVLGSLFGSTAGDSISLRGPSSGEVTLHVRQVLPEHAPAALGDVALVHMQVARTLASIPEGKVRDIAALVFHEDEAEVLRPEIRSALGRPVRMVTRTEASGGWQAAVSGASGLASLVGVPALLALLILVAGAARDTLARRTEVGLLRSLGWSTSDLLRVQLARGLVLALPAVLVSQSGALVLASLPATRWMGARLLGWQDLPVRPLLDPAGSVAVICMALALVALPWLMAMLLPVLSSASADPVDMMQEVP